MTLKYLPQLWYPFQLYIRFTAFQASYCSSFSMDFLGNSQYLIST